MKKTGIALALAAAGVRLPNPATSESLAMGFLIFAHTWAGFPLVMVMNYAALQTIPKVAVAPLMIGCME